MRVLPMNWREFPIGNEFKYNFIMTVFNYMYLVYIFAKFRSDSNHIYNKYMWFCISVVLNRI